MKILQECGIPI